MLRSGWAAPGEGTAAGRMPVGYEGRLQLRTASQIPATTTMLPYTAQTRWLLMKLLGANATSRPWRIQTTPAKTRTIPPRNPNHRIGAW